MKNQELKFSEVFETCLTMVKMDDPQLEQNFQYEIAMEKAQNTWKILKYQGIVKQQKMSKLLLIGLSVVISIGNPVSKSTYVKIPSKQVVKTYKIATLK